MSYSVRAEGGTYYVRGWAKFNAVSAYYTRSVSGGFCPESIGCIRGIVFPKFQSGYFCKSGIPHSLRNVIAFRESKRETRRGKIAFGRIRDGVVLLRALSSSGRYRSIRVKFRKRYSYFRLWAFLSYPDSGTLYFRRGSSVPRRSIFGFRIFPRSCKA